MQYKDELVEYLAEVISFELPTIFNSLDMETEIMETVVFTLDSYTDEALEEILITMGWYESIDEFEAEINDTIQTDEYMYSTSI